MRDLSSEELDRLLGRQVVARLGVCDPKLERAYVVPVSYVRHDGRVYFHSAPGLKLDLLRQHKGQICFEVDEIADEGEWQSLIAWGRFEEIRGAQARQNVLRAFGDRLARGPLRDRQNVGRAGSLGGGEVVYCIVIEEMTGRADSSGWIATESD